MIIDNARVFWEAGGFVRQKIITEDGILSECTHDNSGFDASGMYILPGLVDIHLHGALGYDFSDHTKEALLASDESVLAGSVCNLADMLQNAVKFGVDADSAVKAATINPAKSVGLEKEAGVLSIGRRADLLFTSEDFTPLYVMKNGKMKKV